MKKGTKVIIEDILISLNDDLRILETEMQNIEDNPVDFEDSPYKTRSVYSMLEYGKLSIIDSAITDVEKTIKFYKNSIDDEFIENLDYIVFTLCDKCHTEIIKKILMTRFSIEEFHLSTISQTDYNREIKSLMKSIEIARKHLPIKSYMLIPSNPSRLILNLVHELRDLKRPLYIIRDMEGNEETACLPKINDEVMKYILEALFDYKRLPKKQQEHNKKDLKRLMSKARAELD